MRDRRALFLWVALACIAGAFALGHYRPPYDPPWIDAMRALAFTTIGCCLIWFAFRIWGRPAARPQVPPPIAEDPDLRPKLAAFLDFILDGQIARVSITVRADGIWELRGYDGALDLVCVALACPHDPEAASPAYRPVLILHGAGSEQVWGEVLVDEPRKALTGFYEAVDAGTTDAGPHYFH